MGHAEPIKPVIELPSPALEQASPECTAWRCSRGWQDLVDHWSTAKKGPGKRKLGRALHTRRVLVVSPSSCHEIAADTAHGVAHGVAHHTRPQHRGGAIVLPKPSRLGRQQITLLRQRSPGAETASTAEWTVQQRGCAVSQPAGLTTPVSFRGCCATMPCGCRHCSTSMQCCRCSAVASCHRRTSPTQQLGRSGSGPAAMPLR